jgi:dTDP-L-rhamnose 4-epimerase
VGTSLLYEVIREHKLPVRKIVVASSQAVYGEGQYQCGVHGLALPGARPLEQMARAEWDLRCARCRNPLTVQLLEEQHTNPYNPYALAKYSQELVALRLGRLLGIPTVALRYSITQGPRQSPYNAYSGICRIFTSRLLNNEAPIVYEDGRQLRDYVHVSDVVRANMLVLKDARADFEAFNVGSGAGTTVLEYARLLSQTLGTDIQPVVPGKYRFGDNRHSVSSIQKLRALGWAPQKTLLDILQDYATWRRSFVLEGESYQKADKEMEESGIVRAAGSQLSQADG